MFVTTRARKSQIDDAYLKSRATSNIKALKRNLRAQQGYIATKRPELITKNVNYLCPVAFEEEEKSSYIKTRVCSQDKNLQVIVTE